MAEYDKFGREIPDDTPVEMPLGWKRPQPLIERIREIIRVEMSQQGVDQGFESFEEADDFETGEEDDLVSKYEMTDMQEEFILPVPDKGAGKDGTSTSGDRKGDVGKGGGSVGVAGARDGGDEPRASKQSVDGEGSRGSGAGARVQDEGNRK